MRSMRILYIDDNPSELEVAARVLLNEGYFVTTCATVDEAKPFLNESDIVIIDYYMPGLNGEQVLAELRRSLTPGGPRPVFYLYTSDFQTGSTYREMNFDGRIILKGNTEALVKQVNAAARALSLRRLRPH